MILSFRFTLFLNIKLFYYNYYKIVVMNLFVCFVLLFLSVVLGLNQTDNYDFKLMIMCTGLSLFSLLHVVIILGRQYF